MEGFLPDIVIWTAGALALLPTILLRKRVKYLRAPDNLIPIARKEQYARVQFIGAIVLAIVTFMLLRDYSAYYGAWFAKAGVILVPTIGMIFL